MPTDGSRFGLPQSIPKGYPLTWIVGTAYAQMLVGYEPVRGCPPDMGLAKEKKAV